MAILNAELSDNEDEININEEIKREKKRSKRILHSVKWVGKSTFKYKGNDCYDAATVGK